MFSNYGYKKIILDTNLNNTRAQHVYEKLGFKKVRVKIRAWIELNYIYFYIIEKISFELFKTEAIWFLSREEDIRQQMNGVNLCNLRLSDMENTILDVTALPYDEIEQEACDSFSNLSVSVLVDFILSCFP